MTRLITLLVVLTGCEQQQPIEPVEMPTFDEISIGRRGRTVTVFHDDKRNVTCWEAESSYGLALTCLRDEKEKKP